MTTVTAARPIIDTPAGPLEVYVGSARSEYDVEVEKFTRARWRAPSDERRYASASTVSPGYAPDGTRHDGTRLRINGVDYTARIDLRDMPGRGWEVKPEYGAVSLRRDSFDEATPAAHRHLRDRIVPLVIDWLNAHPAEVAAMEAAHLDNAIKGTEERIARAEAAVEALRDLRGVLAGARTIALSEADR